MNNLILINEISINGYNSNILDVISFISVLLGIFTITSKNPIISILFLIGLFASISCYLILLGLSFIGLSYLIVYIGAVSILFLFILMLINIRVSELHTDTSNSILLSIIIIILFNFILFQILPYSIAITNNFTSYLNNFLFKLHLNKSNINNLNFFNADNDNIFFVTSKTWDNNLGENSHITAIGNIMYTNYSLWLMIASFILLLAMVGAIVITIKQKN